MTGLLSQSRRRLAIFVGLMVGVVGFAFAQTYPSPKVAALTLTNLLFTAGAPTFTSGGCVGAMGGTPNGTAAFTVTTGAGACTSAITLGMPAAAHGWICDGGDMAIAGTAAIRETANTATSVTLTNYSIGTSPAATNFIVSHTINVKCAAY